MKTHEGRIAVVSGAARGIGQALCRRLGERGARVAGVDLADASDTGRQVVAAGGDWLGIEADVTSPEDVTRACREVESHFGGCDILVNNAGIFGYVDWDALDWATWRRYHSINVDSQFLMCKAFVPAMKKRGWGRIVNVTSDSVLIPMTGSVPYKASKMAVIGLTRGLAGDLAPFGITVNAASPSLTRTPGVMERIGEERLQMMSARQLIKKMAEPDDLAGLVLFLTSDDAYFVTGQTIMADGGLTFV